MQTYVYIAHLKNECSFQTTMTRICTTYKYGALNDRIYGRIVVLPLETFQI